jgi:tripartite-type tricarboxylate transporter receptor subunit TctC
MNAEESTVNRRRVIARTLGLGAAVVAAPWVRAQTSDWPARLVKFIVPFSPGSGTDILARILAESLQKSTGKPFIVENKQGADGIVGTEQVVRSTPDGYTFGVIPSSPIVMNPALYTKQQMRFDPAKELIPVANIAGVSCVLGVQPEMPVRNVAELVAYAKANPGKLNYAAGSTFTHLAGEMFKHLSGTDIAAIPYKGTAPQVTAMLGKEVQIIFDPFLGVDHFRNGKIRGLAVTGSRRSSVFPELPTLAEAGIKDYQVETWIGVFAPVGTPAPMVEQLHREVNRVFATPEARDRLARLSYEPMPDTQEQMARRIAADTARWAKIVKDSNFQINK